MLPGVEVGKPTHFTVLTKGAGKAKLDVQFAGAAKGEVVRDFEIIDNHDYSYTVKYTAVQQVCPNLACSPHPADQGPGCPSSNLIGPFWILGPFLPPILSHFGPLRLSVHTGQGDIARLYPHHPFLTF